MYLLLFAVANLRTLMHCCYCIHVSRMRTYKLMRHLAVDPPARALRSGCECFSVCFGTCNELDMESVTPSCVYVSCLLGLKCLIY